MKDVFEKYFYTNWYAESLEQLKQDLLFYEELEKPEVKALYWGTIELQRELVEKLKDKIKNYG